MVERDEVQNLSQQRSATSGYMPRTFVHSGAHLKEIQAGKLEYRFGTHMSTQPTGLAEKHCCRNLSDTANAQQVRALVYPAQDL